MGVVFFFDYKLVFKFVNIRREFRWFWKLLFVFFDYLWMSFLKMS